MCTLQDMDLNQEPNQSVTDIQMDGQTRVTLYVTSTFVYIFILTYASAKHMGQSTPATPDAPPESSLDCSVSIDGKSLGNNAKNKATTTINAHISFLPLGIFLSITNLK